MDVKIRTRFSHIGGFDLLATDTTQTNRYRRITTAYWYSDFVNWFPFTYKTFNDYIVGRRLLLFQWSGKISRVKIILMSHCTEWNKRELIGFCEKFVNRVFRSSNKLYRGDIQIIFCEKNILNMGLKLLNTIKTRKRMHWFLPNINKIRSRNISFLIKIALKSKH